MRYVLPLALLVIPAAVHAQASLKTFTADITAFVNTSVVPLIYAIAFLVFLVGMVRFFFIEGEEARQKGKQLMLWGIIGFVVMFSVWGIVNMLLATLGVRS